MTYQHEINMDYHKGHHSNRVEKNNIIVSIFVKKSDLTYFLKG